VRLFPASKSLERRKEPANFFLANQKKEKKRKENREKDKAI
jgi:hypothetical protein